MSYTDTYTPTSTECLAGEFVTVYGSAGYGRIHAKGCPKSRVRGSQIRTATSPGAIRNGCAEVAPCCRDHEARLFYLVRKLGVF